MAKTIVITGASTGIGHAAVRALLKKGFRVYGSVRKKSDADRLSSEFGAPFSPLVFDITDPEGIRAAAGVVRSQLKETCLAGLVNNAGIAITGPLLHINPEELRYQLEVNLVGTLRVTQAFAPLLGIDRSQRGPRGRIVNIGSVSGKIAYPYMGPYTISKFGLEAYTETLRQELMLYGIRVILLSPGLVETPLCDKASNADDSVYLKTEFGPSIQKFKDMFNQRRKQALMPEAVAQLIVRALTTSHPRYRYTVAANLWTEWLLPQWIPKRVVNRAISKQLSLAP